MMIDPRFLSSETISLNTWTASYTVHPPPFTRNQWDRVPTHDPKECNKHVGWAWGRSTKLENCQFENRVNKITEQRYESENVNTFPSGDRQLEQGKMEIPLFSPCTWKEDNGRRLASNVETVTMFVADIDDVTEETKDAILERLTNANIMFYAYSSFSQGLKTGECFRVILPLDRPVPADDWNKVWLAVERHLISEMDQQAKDAHRFYYLPSNRADRRDGFWNIASETGFQLSVDALITSFHEDRQTSRSPATGGNNPPPNPPTAPADAGGDDNNGEDANGRWVVQQVLPTMEIFLEDDRVVTFQYIIDNWDNDDDLPKDRRGFLRCRSRLGGSNGGSWIQCRPNDLHGLPQFRHSNSGRRIHSDCINTVFGLELVFRNRGARWFPSKNVDNIVKMLGMLGLNMHCDKRTQWTYIDGERFEDHHYTILHERIRGRWFQMDDIPETKVIRAIDFYVRSQERDTLVEYLESLEYDPSKPSVLESLFVDFLGAEDTTLNRIYAKKWAISAVSRALNWGSKVDTMLILQGVQGIRKSTFFRVIAGACAVTGEPYFSEEPIDVKSVDGLTKLRLAWIHEWAELSGMSHSDLNDVKQFLTKRRDIYRKKYGRKEVVVPRNCVVCGSTNDEKFLRDNENRRYWVVRTSAQQANSHAFQIEDLESVRDQVWAEAVHLYKQGHEWWLTPEEQALSNSMNDSFTAEDAHENMVKDWVESHPHTLFRIQDMIDSIYTETYEDDSGFERTRMRSIKPKSYLPFYADVLAKMGATKHEDGRRVTVDGVRGVFWTYEPAQEYHFQWWKLDTLNVDEFSKALRLNLITVNRKTFEEDRLVSIVIDDIEYKDKLPECVKEYYSQFI